MVGRQRAQGTKYVTNPKRLDSPAARARLPSQSGRSRCLRVPRTKLLEWLINGLIDCLGHTYKTAKSVTQEGRKVKPILPTTPSRCTDRTPADIT